MSITKAHNLIKIGLARRGEKGNFASLASMAGAPVSATDLNSLTFRQIDRVKVLQAQAAKIATRMVEYERKASAEVAEMGLIKTAHPTGGTRISDSWNEAGRRQELDSRLAAHRKALMAEVEEQRMAAKKGLKADAELLASVRSAWDDPVALLHRGTLADASRRIYKDNLADARPRALENAIKEGVLTGNRPLVAAGLDVLDTMPPDEARQVNVSKSEAAALVLGDAYVKVQHQLAAFDLAILRAEHADAEIVGRGTAEISMKIGLAEREVKLWAGEIDFAEVEAEITEAAKGNGTNGSGDE